MLTKDQCLLAYKVSLDSFERRLTTRHNGTLTENSVHLLEAKHDFTEKQRRTDQVSVVWKLMQQ